MQQHEHAELVSLLDLAMRIPTKGETAVHDFTVELFKCLDYVYRIRVARTGVDIPFNICGEVRDTKTDVCLVDRLQNDIILLVQEDKRPEDTESTDAQAQLVAEAVADFTQNNVNRDAQGLPPLAEKVIPGIVMVGTMPTFFKIPITQTLETHIAFGIYPPDETVVTYCYPPVPRPHSEGMKPLDNRRKVLKCYEAFKAIVGI
ncbi:hypothetical protein Agabi119p4_13 [Agaricus bisporus var. burnettii]|uniref:Uncharacterized protein n=1 Tax=Agaricus bisporus var. burnettii TaxID=192524 RepID=A0A8H7KKC6_AGABI|nr:hypothetical protein Agabi119p4_13 [Agaricus bisporus var. burnettii]